MTAGQIVDPRFGFKWGFCGAFNSEPGLLPVTIGPEGHWKGFGEESAIATGRAYMRSGRKVLRPRVTVTLLELVEEAKFSIYEELEYVIHGRVPPGFGRKGSVFL